MSTKRSALPIIVESTTGRSTGHESFLPVFVARLHGTRPIRGNLDNTARIFFCR